MSHQAADVPKNEAASCEVRCTKRVVIRSWPVELLQRSLLICRAAVRLHLTQCEGVKYESKHTGIAFSING